jgi:hypothetical protein
VADRRPRGTGFIVASVLAVVFFASTVLLAVVAVGLKDEKDDLQDARNDVAAVAGRFVEELLGYDYRDPQGYRDRVLALTAAPFTDQFATAVAGLEADFEVARSVSVGTVEEVYVAEVGTEGTATAIVRYSRTLDGEAGPRRETNLYVQLGLIEREPGWRINDVINLNLAFSGSAPVEGTTSTTTG